MSSNNTIKIAHKEVTMEDMFKRPEYVNGLKQLQEVLHNISEQSKELQKQSLKPTAVLINHKTYNLIARYATPEIFQPIYQSQNNPSDRLMGLDIAILQSLSETPYVRVVV